MKHLLKAAVLLVVLGMSFWLGWNGFATFDITNWKTIVFILYCIGIGHLAYRLLRLIDAKFSK